MEDLDGAVGTGISHHSHDARKRKRAARRDHYVGLLLRGTAARDGWPQSAIRRGTQRARKSRSDVGNQDLQSLAALGPDLGWLSTP